MAFSCRKHPIDINWNADWPTVECHSSYPCRAHISPPHSMESPCFVAFVFFSFFPFILLVFPFHSCSQHDDHDVIAYHSVFSPLSFLPSPSPCPILNGYQMPNQIIILFHLQTSKHTQTHDGPHQTKKREREGQRKRERESKKKNTKFIGVERNRCRKTKQKRAILGKTTTTTNKWRNEWIAIIRQKCAQKILKGKIMGIWCASLFLLFLPILRWCVVRRVSLFCWQNTVSYIIRSSLLSRKRKRIKIQSKYYTYSNIYM